MSEYMKNIEAIRSASHLLPDPGGEVVRELLDDYSALLVRYNEAIENGAALEEK